VERFEGRTAVVTGAASGIGRALAVRFGELGMKVVLADIEEPRLAEAVEVLWSSGVDALPVVTDVSSADSVDALAAGARAAYGNIHVLCNNAGVGGGGMIASLTLADWQWVLGVNLWGVVHGLRSFLPAMLASGEEGHVVNTASIAGLVAGPMNAPYNASKSAVVAITEGLHAELAMTGAALGASVLCPGFVNTDIADAARNRPIELARTGDAAVAVPPEVEAELRARFAAALPPSAVADVVERGIRERRLHLFTDAEFLPAVEIRFQTILGAFARPSP
jgi:NAD(P)-dependent dehydrogenase (short-subunit alcohol dehydrogenase family)